MTTQKRTGDIDFNATINGDLTVSESASIGSALTVTGNTSCVGTLTASGATSLKAITLTQTLGGTDVTATWATAAAPVLTIGNFYFTFTYGSSTFRVPCFPTT